VIEEDPMIRDTTSSILAGAGFNVTAVADQDQAFAELANGGAPIELLLTDIVVNGASNGIELEAAEKLKAEHPQLKTLFVSGQPELSKLVKKSADTSFLQRPFLGNDLIKSAQGMLTKDVA
jgi:DNA-binding NtrC family response regulator